MDVTVRLLGPGDEALVARSGHVFDDPPDARATAAFLADPSHLLAVAESAGRVLGFASAVRYEHPDKAAPELWINEVGVEEGHRGRGVGRRLVQALLEAGRAAGCAEAWVLTEEDNEAARRAYLGAGGVEAEARPVLIAFPLS